MSIATASTTTPTPHPNPPFTPPAPGSWGLDRSHYPGGTTPVAQWLMEGCPAGMRRAFEELGIPAETLDVRFVNGFMYSRLRPLIRPDSPAAKLPPLPVLKLATRLHPTFRRRATQAAAALRERPWRTAVAEWSSRTRPRLEARNLELQEVDPALLDDAALAGHLDDLLAWCRETFELHFYLHAFDLGPLGMLLHECARWGIAATDVVPALGGASPSTAAPAAVLAALRIEATAGGVRPTSLDELRACSPEARRLLDGYLRVRGQMMITRYDLDGQTLAERPGTVLASVLDGNVAPADHRVADEAVLALRERVPVAERALYDERMTEARAALDLRDDNGPFTVEWPVGLLRRGLLALGRRRAAEGRIAAAEHVFELAPDEVGPLARAGGGPDAAELAGRAAQRRRQAALTPPARLGPVEPAPPLSAMAPAHQVLVGAVQAVLQHLGMAGDERPRAAADDGLRGVGVGERTYRGRARLADDPEAALDRLEPGDVLVVRFTTPAYNTVLTLAGALVTADGGALCHAAVMARELGIPAVIGAPGALERLTDGELVEVDPVAGTVRPVR